MGPIFNMEWKHRALHNITRNTNASTYTHTHHLWMIDRDGCVCWGLCVWGVGGGGCSGYNGHSQSHIRYRRQEAEFGNRTQNPKLEVKIKRHLSRTPHVNSHTDPEIA